MTAGHIRTYHEIRVLLHLLLQQLVTYKSVQSSERQS
jgi:hypothetical protein